MFKQAVVVSELPEVRSSMYPEPFRSRMGDRVKRRLGEAFGLKQFGVNLVRLQPGGQSALRHFHSHEEELVYVLEGELVLITNVGEQTVRAGMCVGFPANTGDAHHLVNRSTSEAVYIEVGSREEDDQAFYPDDDLCWLPDGKGGMAPGHKNGAPY
ncbi:MAG: cupin domain-containing protein [Polyangiaceae bacterium]